MEDYAGRLLAGGRYQLLKVVGVGGMAVVYRARDRALGRYIAIKILKEEFVKDPDIRRRFAIESQAVAKLSHHNIVSVYDVGRDGELDYIVMEYIEGITLKDYLKKMGYLKWRPALIITKQIAAALEHAHSRGVIHQDVKPQNIMILQDGTAKLTDFGIASFAATQETRVVQEAIGSVHYVSPEQAKGIQIDFRTDIYSLGVVMYEMLTGKMPFDGDSVVQVVMQRLKTTPPAPSVMRSDIPHGFDEIVMHAMCANIGNRYASAAQLSADLERLEINPNTTFGYKFGPTTGDETRILGADVRNAVRQTWADKEGRQEPAPEDSYKRPRDQHREYAPRRDRAPHQGRASSYDRAPRRQHTEPQEEGFFERVGERPGLAAAIALGVVALVAIVVTGILLATGQNTNKEPENTLLSVPLFIGEKIDEVLTNQEWTTQFSLQEADARKESTRPEGEVIDQSVEAEDEVPPGTSIVLTVSAGGEDVSDTYKIVDFRDRSLSYVEAVLEGHKVAYEVEYEYSDNVEYGNVTRTDPEAQEELAKDATLTVYVSLGPEVREVTVPVPDLFGMTEEAARQAITESGLTVGSIDQAENEAEAGTVIWQSAEKNTQVKEGTTINLQISKGKQPDEALDGTFTDPNGTENNGEASQTPEGEHSSGGATSEGNEPSSDNQSSDDNGESGNEFEAEQGGTPDPETSGGSESEQEPEEGSAHIPVVLPPDTDSANVSIFVDGTLAHSNPYSTSSGSVTITVPGTVGEHSVTVMVDGQSTTETYMFN